jgi:hypothetical protein
MGDIIQIVTVVVLGLLAYLLAKVYDTLAHIWHVSFVPVHADVDGWRGRHSFKLAVIFSV